MGSELILMRHGESVWTQKSVNKFAGWVDVPLSGRGKDQAVHAGRLLASAGLKPDIVFTSLLSRSIWTADIVLDQIDRSWIPVQRTWRLNERHYGAFQGKTRPDMLQQYGKEKFALYRRSFNVRPPDIDTRSPFFQINDPRYGPSMQDHLDQIDPAGIRAECLQDLLVRLKPYWRARIIPPLESGSTVLLVTHGSVVRSLIKILDDISDHDIASINVPTGIPLVYKCDRNREGILQVRGPGRYLDPGAARRGMEEIANLGGEARG